MLCLNDVSDGNVMQASDLDQRAQVEGPIPWHA